MWFSTHLFIYLFLDSSCFGSVCPFYTSLHYFYVQNGRSEYLFTGHQSLSLSGLALEQYLLKLFINMWNNLSCNSKYILQEYYCIGIWKKKLENFRRHMYIEKRIWSFPSIHQQLLTQKCQKWQISANVAFCAYSRFHMDTGAYGPTFYQKSSEIFQCLQFAWQWWASDTLFAMLKLSVS